jgi:hypothetical protein
LCKKKKKKKKKKRRKSDFNRKVNLKIRRENKKGGKKYTHTNA